MSAGEEQQPESKETPPQPATAMPAKAPPAGFGVRDLLLGIVAMGGAATLMFAFLQTRAVSSAEVAASAASPAANAPAAEAHVAVPAWSSKNQTLWLGTRRKGVAFELPSDNRVAIWMRTVQPALIVRCTGGKAEAFVLTQSPAKLEANTDDHTVTFGFDDGADTTERWPDSSEHDALFAPDGSVMARKIAAAKTMRFSFTPHNAPPATMKFQVSGLATLLEPAAKDCGWKTSVAASRLP